MDSLNFSVQMFKNGKTTKSFLKFINVTNFSSSSLDNFVCKFFGAKIFYKYSLNN